MVGMRESVVTEYDVMFYVALGMNRRYSLIQYSFSLLFISTGYAARMTRLWLSFFLTLAVCFSGFEAVTIFRPAQRISNNFKQLNLSPEEIDPNVAPPESIINGDQDDYIYFNSGTTGATQSSELIDESINEISLASPAVTPLITATTPATLLNSTPTKNTNDSGGLIKFCKCTENHCDCCRDFNLPFIPIKGPGCAKITYLGDEKMSVTLKYGDLTLASRTISSKLMKFS